MAFDEKAAELGRRDFSAHMAGGIAKMPHLPPRDSDAYWSYKTGWYEAQGEHDARTGLRSDYRSYSYPTLAYCAHAEGFWVEKKRLEEAEFRKEKEGESSLAPVPS